MKYFISWMFLIFLSGCVNHLDPEKVNVDKEVAALKTDKDIQVYLEGIRELSQRAMKRDKDALSVHGKNSTEHNESRKEVILVYNQNVSRIEKIFEKHGFPSEEKYGKKAANAAWFVIYTSSGYAPKERNFKYMYQGYKRGDLPEKDFSLYLNRMHKLKFKNEFMVEGSFKESDRINTLIEKLGLKIE